MALSITEQLEIINGNISPRAVSLREMVAQIVLNATKDFYTGVKTVECGTSPLACSYIQKMVSIFSKITSVGNEFYTDKIIRILIAIYSDEGTINGVLAATDTQWEAFLSANVLETLEILATVLPSEKTEYNAL